MFWIPLLFALAPQEAFPTPIQTGSIEGRVLDVRSRAVPCALVLICDGESGIPLGEVTHQTFLVPGPDGERGGLDDWWAARTDEDGRFRFDEVPVGSVRLIAQSFPDAVDPRNPLDKYGLNVRLRGTSDPLKVEAARTALTEIRPLGDSSFVYNRGASNDDWYLFLSRGAPRADPVLGPLGWQGPFLEEAIGWVRMKGGQTVVQGLPPGVTHYVIFANDSSPCFGAGSFRLLGSDVAAHDTNLVGGWSDAIHNPPERLAQLTKRVKTLMAEGGYAVVEALLAEGREEQWERAERGRGFAGLFDAARILGPLERKLELPWGGEASVADVMAAAAYVRLAR